MRRITAVAILAILFSSCAGMDQRAGQNEPLAIDLVIKKTPQTKLEVTLQEPDSLREEPPPPTEYVKFTPPTIIEHHGDGYEIDDDDRINTTVGSSEVEGPTAVGDYEEIVSEDEIYTIVEEMPEFPGGQPALANFMQTNIHYPEMAKEQGIQGKVWVGFMVDKEGNIHNVVIKRGIGGGCDEEAKRVVSKMPQWKPGKQSGRPVKVNFVLPINFTLR